MNVVLFGATGMVGQGVLRECLLDPDVAKVLSVVRRPSGTTHHPKLVELVLADFTDYAGVDLAGYDACFFCLGVSAAGMTEADYTRVTYDFPLAAARALLAASPGITFVYVSGEGTDATEKGRSMWARVKGRAENALRALGFKAAYMFRPGLIRPMHGARSRTFLYRLVYILLWPFLPLLGAVAPGLVTSTEKVGRAMLIAAKRGAPAPVLQTRDINRLAGS